MRKVILVVSAALLSASQSVLALNASNEEFHAWNVEGSVWEADAELGIVLTSGNTESESFNGKFRVLNERRYWRHRLRGAALLASEEEESTAERYQTDFKTDYKLTSRDYLFGNLRYEKDRFANIDYRTSETVGYGRRVLARDGMRWDVEAGAGARQLRPRDGSTDNEAMLRFASDFMWQFTDVGRFTQSVLVESTDDETLTEAEAALRGSLTERLGLSLSFTLRHTDSVPADTERTDTITALNLTYQR